MNREENIIAAKMEREKKQTYERKKKKYKACSHPTATCPVDSVFSSTKETEPELRGV